MGFQVIKNIKLNLLRPELTVVHGKQYDNEARIVVAQLYEDNTKWYAPANTLGVISYIKPDGNYGFYDETDLGNPAVIFNENDRSIVTLVLSTQTLTCAGKVKVEVNFYDQQQAERLSSFAFTLDVEKSAITQDDLTSSSEFRILAEQITEVLTAAANLSGMEADAESGAVGTDADVTVTGGTAGNPYHLHFTIPRGNTGEKGDPPTLTSSAIAFQLSTSGSTIPTGTWLDSPPATLTRGQYLWTRTTVTFETGSPVVSYSISYIGTDGQGAPSSTIPSMDGTASAGVENGYSRGDHVHPSDTSRAAVSKVFYDVIEVTLPDVSASSLSFNVTGVTADHELVQQGSAYLSNPYAITSDLNVTTGDGTVTVSGTFVDQTDIVMTLGIKAAKQTGTAAV